MQICSRATLDFVLREDWVLEIEPRASEYKPLLQSSVPFPGSHNLKDLL